MIGAAFKFVEVASSSDSVVEQIDPKRNNKIINANKGSLHILIQVSSGLVLLQMHPFMQGINPNDKIIYDKKDKHYKLILCLVPNNNQTWLVKVNQNSELLLDILSERCKLVERKAANVISSQIMNRTQKVQPVHDDSAEKKSTETKLLEASQRFGNFLRYTGGKFSQTFEKLGNYFAAKVSPSQEMHFSDKTKKLVDKSLQGSNKLYEIYQQQLSALFHMASKQTRELSNKIESTQKGKSIKQSQGYNQAKGKLNTGLHIIYNIYDGYSDGVSNAITGFGKGSTEVVQAKYGKQAADVNYDIVHAAKNLYNIYKLPKKKLVGYFNPKNSQETNNRPPQK